LTELQVFKFAEMDVENPAFRVPNGFLGMQRDIILRLCCLIWYIDLKIRAVYFFCLLLYEQEKRGKIKLSIDLY
jgi:hypothetical protein